MRNGRKPVQWDRNPRAQDMEHAIRCNEYADQPPITRRPVATGEDVPMFDVEPEDACIYVPVEGWPAKPRKNGVDHA